jgi:hypothetical protein
MWRIFQLNKHLSKDGHVWRKFGSGNRESLSAAAKALKEKGLLRNGASTTNAKDGLLTPIDSRGGSPTPSVVSTNSEVEADGGAVGRETRRRVMEWWSKEYCASRMHLCVVGKGWQICSYHVITPHSFAPQRLLMNYRNWLSNCSHLSQVVVQILQRSFRNTPLDLMRRGSVTFIRLNSNFNRFSDLGLCEDNHGLPRS